MSGDLWWSNVKLIAHFDGPDIAFNEKQRAVQLDNRLTLSTAEKRFGASSLALPGLEGAGVVYYGGGYDVGDLGPDDFTIEFFFQREYSGSRVDYLVSSRQSNGVAGYSWGLLVDDQDRLIWRGDVRGESDVVLWATPDWPPGWWKHIAVTRSGGTLRCFIDGVQTYSGTDSANYRSPNPVFVGFNGTSGGVWPEGTRTGACHGYMDELRITSGTARYTANFTPPTATFPNEYGTGGGGGGGGGSTAADPYWDNVVLLLPFDGANGSSTFTDASKAARSFTVQGGGIAISTAQSRFGGASAAFLNTDGYLVTDNTADIQFRTGDFTVEFWLYNNVPWVSQYNAGIVGQRANDSSSGWQVYRNTAIYTDKMGVRIGTIWAPNGGDFFSNSTPDVGVWEHWALTRQGNTLRWFKNGVLDNTGTTTEDINEPGGALRVGAPQTWGGVLNAYIDDLRITKGIARYTANFTPPATAFPKRGVTPNDPYWNDVLLYLPMTGDNNSSTFTDFSPNPKNVSNSGSVRVSQAQSKYGGTSAYFDGQGWLDMAGMPAGFLQGDFTIEGWVYYTGSQQQTFFNTAPHNVLGVSMNRDGTGKTLLVIGNGGVWTGFVTSAGALAANSWNHIAVVRSGVTSTLYHNGVAQGSLNDTPGNLSGARIGAITLGFEFLTGYIDDFRITKAARYLGNFTPPGAIDGGGGGGTQPDPTTPAIRGNWNFDFRAKVSPETRKDLPPPAAKNFPDRVREEVSTLLGKRGDSLDKAVTVRDLVDGGIIQVRPGWQGGTSPVGGFGPAFPQPVEAYEPDLTPPPGPTNFSATAGFGLVYLQTDSPAFTMGHGYGRTRIYGAKRAQGAQAPVFSDAVLVYEFTGTIGAMPSDPATTWHLWAKWRTKDGVDSTAPAGGTNGVVATTGQDPGVLIDTLTGQITEEMLYVDLSNRINLIDGPASLTNSVAARLAAEASARATAISQEASARATAISQEASARGTAITNESNLRSEADSALAQQISTLTANVSGTFATVAALQTEQTARADGDTAQTSARETLATQLRGAYTGTDLTKVTAGLVFSEREARVSADGALSSRAEALEATVNSPTTGLTATRATLTNDYYTKTQTDSAISASATTLSAAVGTKNRTFVQAAAPSPASGRVLGDLWFNTSDNNKLNRFDGTAWVAVDDARIASTQSNLSSNYYTKASTDSAISAATLNLVSNSALTTTLSSYATTATLSNDYYTKTQTDSAISTSSSTLTANFNTTLTGYATTAAIQAEATARTNADSAMAAQIAVLQAASGNSEAIVNLTNLVNAKSANFVQSAAPTATKVNDLWIDTTNGANLLKRWDGTAWVAAEDTRIGSTASTVSTLQASTSTLNTKVAALEVSSTAQASDITGLKAQYTVKIDLNGYVAGFGLAANAPNDNSSTTSSFAVRADRFYVGPPTNYSQEATPGGATAGQIWYRPSDKKFFAWSGTAWEPWKNSLPFIVQTTPQTINGVNVPAGVYMDTAFIKDATISSAMIANLKADKIVSGLVQGNIGVVGAKVAGTEIYVGGSINLDSAQATGILSVTNPDIALNASGATFKVNTFKITQGAGLQTITPFMVDGNGNVIINSAYIGTITAGQINSNGLTIKSTSGATLLDATKNTPPWVVYGDAQAYVDSLVSAGTGGAELVAPTTSSTNTRYIKSLKAGHGIEYESSAEQVTIKATGSEIDSGAMGVGVNVTGVAPVNGLSVTLQANSVYRLTATIRFRGTSATTPTPIFGLRLPSGSGTAQITAQVGSASSVESRIANWPNGGDATATFSAIGAAGAGNQIATIDAVLTTGATGGAASVLAGSGNGLSITIEAASAMFAQRIRRVTQAASTALATSMLTGTYQAEDRRQSTRLPAPLSSAYIVITFKPDGTWQMRGSGNEISPWADGSWLNPSGVVNSGAAWELMVTVGGSPSAGITINNDTIINGQPGFVPVSGDRAISINAAARDEVVIGSFPVSVVARRVGETTTPAAWATFTLQVQAVSVALV